MKQAHFLRLSVLSLALLAAPASAREINEEFSRTFEVSPGARLRLEHGDGDVEIRPWERPQIEVHVLYRADITVLGLGRDDADFEVEFDQSGSTVTVIGRETGRSGFTIGFRSSRQYDYLYTISAPPWIDLEFTGDDGDVSVVDWAGEVDIRLDDGDVNLDGLDSPRVAIEIEDGDVSAERLTGELFVRADDGNVYLSDSDLSWGPLPAPGRRSPRRELLRGHRRSRRRRVGEDAATRGRGDRYPHPGRRYRTESRRRLRGADRCGVGRWRCRDRSSSGGGSRLRDPHREWSDRHRWTESRRCQRGAPESLGRARRRFRSAQGSHPGRQCPPPRPLDLRRSPRHRWAVAARIRPRPSRACVRGLSDRAVSRCGPRCVASPPRRRLEERFPGLRWVGG